MKKKSIISIIVVVILAIAAMFYVTGNHNKSNSNNSASGQTTKITLWTGLTGNYEKSFQKLADSFNSSQKKYQVVLTSQTNYATLSQKIMAAAKSNTLPVMCLTTYTSLSDFKHNNFIQPMNDF